MGQAGINKKTSGSETNPAASVTNSGVLPLHCSCYSSVQRSLGVAGLGKPQLHLQQSPGANLLSLKGNCWLLLQGYKQQIPISKS